jgi:hypothetical protein
MGCHTVIGVEQTILRPPKGNCFAACLASILELPVGAVPNIYEGADTLYYDPDVAYQRMQVWLRGMGLTLTWSDKPDDHEGEWPTWYPDGYWIATHVLPDDMPHATVWRGAKFAWDPYPGSNLPEGQLVMMEWLVLLDPAVLARSLTGRWRRAA